MPSFTKKFVVIDGHALIYRGYYAIPPLRTRSGELVNAVYGFTTVLLNMLQKLRPDYLAVAFDMKGPTFRDELYEDYKATRQPTPDDLLPQIPRIKQVVEAFRIPIFEKEGFEADDMIATLAEHLKFYSEIQFLIVSGDMDLTQLVTNQVQLLAPLTGFNDVKTYNRESVVEKFGVSPEHITDYKALVGDHSDNIKGVEGIGPKGAVTLLKRFGSMEGIYEHLDEILGGMHDKLAAGKESAFACKKLVSLVCDVPLDLDLDACQTHQINGPQIRLLFQELEFSRLLAKFNELNDHWQAKEQPALF